MLEEKQMKRYHRSKKRSQIRIKNDHEEKADGIIGGKLTESSTETRAALDNEIEVK